MGKFFHPILVFFIHLGYFGPLLLGAFDSSFLILPFGNDLLVVSLIAQHHKGLRLVRSGCLCRIYRRCPGAVVVARKFGEDGIRKVAGQKKFDRLKHHLGERSGLAVVVACLAPPPFPFTLVIAVASALDYAMWKLLVINFFSRVGRFIILGLLAIKYGQQFLRIVHTDAFFWSMVGFIVLCLIATGYSVFHWIRSSRSGKKEEAAA